MKSVELFTFAGYNEEFEQGVKAVESASHAESEDKHPLFIVLEGEPGVGKTRFLRGLMDGAQKYHMR